MSVVEAVLLCSCDVGRISGAAGGTVPLQRRWSCADHFAVLRFEVSSPREGRLDPSRTGNSRHVRSRYERASCRSRTVLLPYMIGMTIRLHLLSVDHSLDHLWVESHVPEGRGWVQGWIPARPAAGRAGSMVMTTFPRACPD